MKRALVTGSSGFVGRKFVQYLVNHGYEVYGIDIQPFEDPRPFGYHHAIADCRHLFSNYTPGQVYDLVVHLAATINGRSGIEYEPLEVATNLSIDSMMFNWAITTSQQRVIYYSSSAAYPCFLQNDIPDQYGIDGVKLSESHITFDDHTVGIPDMTYGWAKLTGEYLARIANKSGLRVFVFRPFSGYGTTQSPDYPFSAMINRALISNDVMRVWGDGTQIRDFIHVHDIIAATMEFVEHDMIGPVNLATGIETSMDDLAKQIMHRAVALGAMKEVLPIEHVIDAPRGVSYRVGAPDLMQSLYTPRISLTDGIDMAILTRMKAWSNE